MNIWPLYLIIGSLLCVIGRFFFFSSAAPGNPETEFSDSILTLDSKANLTKIDKSFTKTKALGDKEDPVKFSALDDTKFNAQTFKESSFLAIPEEVPVPGIIKRYEAAGIMTFQDHANIKVGINPKGYTDAVITKKGALYFLRPVTARITVYDESGQPHTEKPIQFKYGNILTYNKPGIHEPYHLETTEAIKTYDYGALGAIPSDIINEYT